MNRYILSDIYPNIIYDKAAQKHLSMAEVLQILNNERGFLNDDGIRSY